MNCEHTENKALIEPLRRAMSDFDENNVRASLDMVFEHQLQKHMPHPIGDITGPAKFYESAYKDL